MKDFIDYVAGNDESDLAKVKAERDYALHCLEREIALCHEATLRAEAAEAKLEQIAIVCTDNMDRSCDHRMALDFVRQIANDMADARHFEEAAGEIERLQRRVTVLEMVIAEEMHPADCHDEANAMIVEEIYKRPSRTQD